MTAGGALDQHPGEVTVAAPPRKAAPGQPWSHQETIALIEAYEEKWYALKRGQLKAQQWEEVSSAVAARCGFDEPSKNGTQCRHKVEKLRKRYRAERLRASPSPSPSPWPYFDRMDRMERGPLPISVRLPPSAAALPRGGGGSNGSDDDDDDDDEDEEEEERAGSNTRSINGILREGNWVFSRASRNSQPLKRTACEMEDGQDDDDDDDSDDDIEEETPRGRGGVLSELAAVMRSFGEGLVRMEKRRMEMIRETEKDWMDMEAKRAEMVIESQRALVETIAGTFSSIKKAKKSQVNM